MKGPFKQLENLSKRTHKEEFIDVFSSQSITQFVNKLNRLVDVIDCTDYEFGKELSECKLKVKGDMFELFTIIWLNAFGGDRSLFIFNTTFSDRDLEGIDLFATNKDGNIICIQSKFIGNSQATFEKNRLETFFLKSSQYVIASETCPTHILFTTASKVDERYKRHEREGSLLIIDKKKIDKFASKTNVGFWNGCKILSEQLFS